MIGERKIWFRWPPPAVDSNISTTSDGILVFWPSNCGWRIALTPSTLHPVRCCHTLVTQFQWVDRAPVDISYLTLHHGRCFAEISERLIIAPITDREQPRAFVNSWFHDCHLQISRICPPWFLRMIDSLWRAPLTTVMHPTNPPLFPCSKVP